MSDKKLTIDAALAQTLLNTEFIANFDRLYGSDLLQRRAPIDRMVDEATGKHEEDARAFARFFIRYVWLPMVDAGVTDWTEDGHG